MLIITSRWRLVGACTVVVDFKRTLSFGEAQRQYHTHEFGDSVLVSRTLNKLASCCRASDGPKQIWRTMVHC